MPRKKSTAPKDEREQLLGPLFVVDAASEGDGRFPDIPELQEAFPTTNAFLVVNSFGGNRRDVPTLTLWQEAHGVKAVLHDRAQKRKAWFTSPSLMGLFGEIDAFLTSPQQRWMDTTGTRPKPSRRGS